MKKQKIIKYTIGGLFLVSLITLFIPLIEIYKVKVSVADIIRIGFKSSDFLNGIGIMTTALEEYIAPYTWFFVLLMVLPCLEGAAIFLFSRPRVVSIMGIVGAVMNTIIAFLLLLKISNVLKAVNSALSLLGTATKLSFVPTILWIVIYGMILFLSVGLLLTPKIIPQKRNLTFQNDTYSMTHNTYPMAHDTYPMAPVNNVSDMNHNAIDFHGSIIGRSGTYNQKVFLLEKEKTAIFGSDERNCDVVIQDIEIQAKQCAVLYDEFYQEYRLLTEYKNSVFLKSGQPLGSNRTYSLPRGTVLYINNPKHIFELG